MPSSQYRAGWLLLLLALSAACSPGPSASLQATSPAVVETTTAPASSWAAQGSPPNPGTPAATPVGTGPAATRVTDLTPPPATPCAGDLCQEKGQFLLSRPIAPPGRDLVDPTYRYGSTQNGAREPHHGVEFLNSSGTPVLAAAGGRVVVAGDDRETIYAAWPFFYGNLVILEHEFAEVPVPVFTLYAHLSAVQVSVGEQVAPGQQIGLVGFTGVATGSHLHFEVRVGENRYENTRNPELWLRPSIADDGEPAGALAGRVVDGQGEMIYLDNLVLERLVGPDRSPVLQGYLETYSDPALAGQSIWGESFALGDLPAGFYRLTFVYRGLQSRDFEVLPGELTLVTFTFDA